jgi:oligopeptide/dipeptide ABC transporter ATP-binding protein
MEEMLTVRNLKKIFQAGKRGVFAGKGGDVHALDGVSFDMHDGEVMVLAGESGCGKTTLALSLMGLEQPTSGSIIFEGKNITHLDPKGVKALRRRIQMVFQDPYESLNPVMRIGEIVAEPLQVHGLAHTPQEWLPLVVQALEDAGLKPAEHFLNRYPHELSGGQRQRVVIAGALVLKPHLLLADEPVSMLDVSIRAEILNLLLELQREKGVSILLITHDLATSAYLADRIAIMYLGKIVEMGTTAEVLDTPLHPYTKALISVIPVPNPRHRKERMILRGNPPNAMDIPSGCRFHPRCPMAFDRCRVEEPSLPDAPTRHMAACWLLEE